MEKSNSLRREELFSTDFEKFPVWTWDIDNVGRIPVLETHPSLARHYPLFIKAQFTSQNYILKGYLVGGSTFYSFGLFAGNETIHFNVNFPPHLIQKNSIKLFSIIGCKYFPLFPLRYESSVRLEEKKQISGNFILQNEKIACIPD